MIFFFSFWKICYPISSSIPRLLFISRDNWNLSLRIFYNTKNEETDLYCMVKSIIYNQLDISSKKFIAMKKSKFFFILTHISSSNANQSMLYKRTGTPLIKLIVYNYLKIQQNVFFSFTVPDF